jgi:predicted glycoside hydrolase/deacetylase ChbG (UPF0249 family)
MPPQSLTNKLLLLGYPPDARLLILNADDFGMCYSENEATLRVIQEGLANSCTLMVPCPWGLHGLQLLRENPDIPFGVHLTAVSEYAYYRWGPLTCLEQVPSLVDETGYFYSEDRIPEFLAQVKLAELETEFRAQIKAVLEAGLQPTHLDSHCHIHTRREEIFEMTLNLAREYGLAVRASYSPFIEQLRRQGYPAVDHDVLDSYDIKTRDKPLYYHKLLRELPVGLSEWAMHPAAGSAELQAITPSWPVRQADFDFLMSREAQEIVQEEGIILLDYASLQELWKSDPGPEVNGG